MAAVSKVNKLGSVSVVSQQAGSPVVSSLASSTRVSKQLAEGTDQKQIVEGVNALNGALATLERRLSSIPFATGVYFKDQTFLVGTDLNLPHRMGTPCRYMIGNARTAAPLAFRPATNASSTTNLILTPSANFVADVYVYPEL